MCVHEKSIIINEKEQFNNKYVPVQKKEKKALYPFVIVKDILYLIPIKTDMILGHKVFFNDTI